MAVCKHFTIGQRRGLGVAWHEPLHVVRLDGAMNHVVVAPRSEAMRTDCAVAAINWVSIPPAAAPMEVQAQVRYRSEPRHRPVDSRRRHPGQAGVRDTPVFHHPRPGGGVLCRRRAAGGAGSSPVKWTKVGTVMDVSGRSAVW